MDRHEFEPENPEPNNNLDEVMKEAQLSLIKPPSLVEDLRYAALGLKNWTYKVLREGMDAAHIVGEDLADTHRRLPRYVKACELVAAGSFVGLLILRSLTYSGGPDFTIAESALVVSCIGGMVGLQLGVGIFSLRNN